MKWIIGLSQTEAQALDAEMLSNARIKLGTVATIWGAFKHPDKNEWCLPWDDDRQVFAELKPKAFLDAKQAEGKVKSFNEIKTDKWKPEKDEKQV